MVPEENPYDCLGLLPGSAPSEVKRRYRQLAKQCHPDSNHDASAEDTLRMLNAAYAFLSDPRRKAAYDSAFAARAAAYNPARVSLAVTPRMYHRREPSAGTALGLALLFLASAGAGFLFSTQNAALAFSSLYSRLFSRAAGSDQPSPPYTFLPSHGAFDGSSGNSPDNSSSAPPNSGPSLSDSNVSPTVVSHQASLP